MTHKRYIQTLLLAALTIWCCLVVSCSDTDDGGQIPDSTIPEPSGEPLTVSGLTRGIGDEDINYEGLTLWIMAVPTDHSDVQSGMVSYNGPVEGGSEISWNSAIYVKNSKLYEMFGFIPADAAESSSITNTSYLEASLTLNNLKPLSDQPVCLITGAIIACNDSLSPTDFLERGSYYYCPIYAQEKGGDNQRYGVRLLADHLYASLKFNIYIDSEYNDRRTIKLKKMELTTEIGKATVNASITLDKTRCTPTPFAFDATPTGTGTDLATVEVFTDDDGQEIKTATAYEAMNDEEKADYITINPGYFGAWLYDDLYLVSTYDVYDKKGNLIRKDCTAKNRLTSKLVRTVSDREVPIKPGEQVTINLTVNPTYLYVLSDPELDNPQVSIE